IQAWNAHDPIALYAASLRREGLLDAAAEQAMRERVAADMRAITAAAVKPEAAPPVDIAANPLLIGNLMFSNEETYPPAVGEPAVPADAPSHLRQLAKKSRSGRAADGAKLSPMRAITLRDALFEALVAHFRHDDRLIAYGEECREWGGTFG